MTIDESTTEVRILIAQTDSANTQFADAVIFKQVNFGYKDFCRRTRILEDTEDITTVANQLEYNWTKNFNKISQVRYIQNSGDIGKVLKPYPGGDNALPEFLQYGMPYHYVIRKAHDTTNKRLVAWPVPGVSSLTLRLTGFLVPDDLTTGQSFIVNDIYQEAMHFYATWKLLIPYSHKSGNARAKMNDAKRSYFEIVADAIGDTQTTHEDGPEETVDVYA